MRPIIIITIITSLTSVLCAKTNYGQQARGLQTFPFQSMIELDEKLVKQAAELWATKNLPTFDWNITVGTFNKNAAGLNDFFVLILRELQQAHFRKACKLIYKRVEKVVDELRAHYQFVLVNSAKIFPAPEELFKKKGNSPVFWPVTSTRLVTEKMLDVMPMKERLRKLDALYIDLNTCITNRKRFLAIAKSCPIIKSYVNNKYNDWMERGKSIAELADLNKCLENHDYYINATTAVKKKKYLSAFIGVITLMHHSLLQLKRELEPFNNHFYRKITYEEKLDETDLVIEELLAYCKNILESYFVLPSSVGRYDDIWLPGRLWLTNITSGQLYPVRENWELKRRPITEMITNLNKSYVELYKRIDDINDFYQFVKDETGCTLPVLSGNDKELEGSYELLNIPEIVELNKCLEEYAEKDEDRKEHIREGMNNKLMLINGFAAQLHYVFLRIDRELFRILSIRKYYEGCYLKMDFIEEQVQECIWHYQKILNNSLELPPPFFTNDKIWTPGQTLLKDFAAGKTFPLRVNVTFKISSIKWAMELLIDGIPSLDKCLNDVNSKCHITEYTSGNKREQYNITEIAKLDECLVMYAEEIKRRKDGFNRKNSSVVSLNGIAAHIRHQLHQIRQHVMQFNISACHKRCQLQLRDIDVLLNELHSHYRSIEEASVVGLPSHGYEAVLPPNWKKWYDWVVLLSDDNNKYKRERAFGVTPEAERINKLMDYYTKLQECVSDAKIDECAIS